MMFDLCAAKIAFITVMYSLALSGYAQMISIRAGMALPRSKTGFPESAPVIRANEHSTRDMDADRLGYANVWFLSCYYSTLAIF